MARRKKWHDNVVKLLPFQNSKRTICPFREFPSIGKFWEITIPKTIRFSDISSDIARSLLHLLEVLMSVYYEKYEEYEDYYPDDDDDDHLSYMKFPICVATDWLLSPKEGSAFCLPCHSAMLCSVSTVLNDLVEGVKPDSDGQTIIPFPGSEKEARSCSFLMLSN